MVSSLLMKHSFGSTTMNQNFFLPVLLLKCLFQQPSWIDMFLASHVIQNFVINHFNMESDQVWSSIIISSTLKGQRYFKLQLSPEEFHPFHFSTLGLCYLVTPCVLESQTAEKQKAESNIHSLCDLKAKLFSFYTKERNKEIL